MERAAQVHVEKRMLADVPSFLYQSDFDASSESEAGKVACNQMTATGENPLQLD
jgi:hypothetical protein